MNAGEGAAAASNGFYEWSHGALQSAGVLPDGHLDPFGAAPAATVDALNYSAEALGNQVSEDGSRAFFVSPDPEARAPRPTQLYVRETGSDGTAASVLVSRDTLLAPTRGLPAGAPSGVLRTESKQGAHGLAILSSYVYASPDGSVAIFQSTDRLTESAPADNLVKAYAFDTQNNTLSYLPGVADSASPSSVRVSSQNGSDFIFEREGELALWSQGRASDVANVSGRPVSFARASRNGSRFVFQTQAAFGALGFNNGGGEFEEVYSYDTQNGSLDCVSCPPAGVAPAGNAYLSNALPSGDLGNTFLDVTGNHGITEDGSRVFFDTADPLVSQDTNGKRDVYEWESGEVHLISSGVSREDSYFGDNSQSGNDVFFGTIEGLAPGDTDDGYDVYDARVPRPGDAQSPSAVPCAGDVCQGPPSVPSLLGAPASATFSGLGNAVAPPVKSAPKRRSKHKTLKHRRPRRGRGGHRQSKQTSPIKGSHR